MGADEQARARGPGRVSGSKMTKLRGDEIIALVSRYMYCGKDFGGRHGG